MDRYIRFSNNNKIHYGLVNGDKVSQLMGEEFQDFEVSDHASADRTSLKHGLDDKGRSQDYTDRQVSPAVLPR